MAKVRLELEPYNAISILAFMREWVNDDLDDEYQFKAIREAVNELEVQLGINLSDEHWEEIDAVNQINQMIGKSPKRHRK
jgi:hypothetical protein